MSNRIDLTQFEGMFEGDHPKNLFEEVEKRFKDDGVRTTPLYLNQQYVNAITLLPDLIAELKRMYEEFDRMKRQRDVAEHAILVLQDFVSEKDIPEIEKRLNAYHE